MRNSFQIVDIFTWQLTFFCTLQYTIQIGFTRLSINRNVLQFNRLFRIIHLLIQSARNLFTRWRFYAFRQNFVEISFDPFLSVEKIQFFVIQNCKTSTNQPIYIFHIADIDFPYSSPNVAAISFYDCCRTSVPIR